MALNSLNVVPAFASAWLFTLTKEVPQIFQISHYNNGDKSYVSPDQHL